jgi:hypothetical protein
MMRLLFVFLLVSLVIGAHAQVLNVESQRFVTDTDGWVGHLGFSFTLQQNTRQVISFGNDGQLQYRKGRSKFLFLSNFALERAGGLDFVNTGYQHLRYNFQFNNILTWEALGQVQYNKVLKMDSRIVFGTGPRFTLVFRERYRMHVGVIYIHEDEKVTGEDTQYHDHRISSYVSLSWNLGKNTELVSTTFYQPNLMNFSDYRIATNNFLEIDIHKHLAFRTGFDLLYDTKQPVGIPNLTYTYRNSFDWKF